MWNNYFESPNGREPSLAVVGKVLLAVISALMVVASFFGVAIYYAATIGYAIGQTLRRSFIHPFIEWCIDTYRLWHETIGSDDREDYSDYEDF